MYCKHCYKMVPDDSAICPECGKPINRGRAANPSKVIIMLIITITVVFGSLTLLGNSSLHKSRDFDIDSYKAAIRICVLSVEESAVHYGNIAQYQNNYWKSLEKLSGTISTEKIIAHSDEWYFEKTGISLSELDEQYDLQSSQYKKIIMEEIDGKEAEQIEELFQTLFTSYMNLRSLVKSPSGSRDNYINQYNQAVSTFTSAQDQLLIFLE